MAKTDSGSYNWQGRLCIEVSPGPSNIVIFGASGDLTFKKLVPSLYSLYTKKLFHEKSTITGCARSPMTTSTFRSRMRESLESLFGKSDRKLISSFLKKLYYVQGSYDLPLTYRTLGKKLSGLERTSAHAVNRIFYLSTPAQLYSTIVKQLGSSGLVNENFEGIPWRNVVLEKPFGRDLESSRKLDRELREILRERQIYRIDHYLGKETVQNILMLRFANSIFEPLWRNQYIDSVQITAAESIGVEARSGYYEKAGLLRDMFQNHMLEMLSLVAMEPPASFAADSVRDEKLKLLRSIRPFPLKKLGESIVRAQYGPGRINGVEVPGYTGEKGVKPNSRTETFAAARILINNWRWEGVPFYLRSGKRMPQKISEIVITFKKVPHSIFDPVVRAQDLQPNQLILNVQPQEGLCLTIQAKQPGPKLCMGDLCMKFNYADVFGGKTPEAYERLLLDCMLGDQTLFIRSDNIDMAWQLFTPVLETWEKSCKDPEHCPLCIYPAGTWGPPEADKMIARHGIIWRNP